MNIYYEDCSDNYEIVFFSKRTTGAREFRRLRRPAKMEQFDMDYDSMDGWSEEEEILE
jgi:hypothetical protein